MDKQRAREVASLQNQLDATREVLKEIRVLQKEHSLSGVVTLTFPARWLTDLASLALKDIDTIEGNIESM